MFFLLERDERTVESIDKCSKMDLHSADMKKLNTLEYSFMFKVYVEWDSFVNVSSSVKHTYWIETSTNVLSVQTKFLRLNILSCSCNSNDEY